MLVRVAIAVTIAAASAGCAGERGAEPMALGFHGAASTADAAKSARVADAEPDATSAGPAAVGLSGGIRQTLGGKVLSAIAFERVTGLKADPSRLRDLH